MISRIELEGLIVERLIEIRRAESTLARRFHRSAHARKDRRAELMFRLADLGSRAGRLESMLDALPTSHSFKRPAAA
jgi:hypothetical protein